MTRKLKVLGLALVAVFAMVAVAASAASATSHHFKIGASSGKLNAAALSNQDFKTVLGTLRCKKLSLNENTSVVPEEEVTEVTVQPKYEECEAVEKGVATFVDPMKCHYLFTGATDANGHAEVHVVCDSEEEAITIQATSLKLKCTDVPPQTITGVHYKNTETESGVTHVDLEATVEEEIHYTVTSGIACGESEGTYENGSYTGNATVTGKDTSGNAIGVSLVTTP